MRLKIKKTGKFKNSKKYLKLINEASVYDVAIDSPTTHAINLSIKEKNNIFLKNFFKKNIKINDPIIKVRIFSERRKNSYLYNGVINFHILCNKIINKAIT